ncbi:transposase, partial [Corynebacterium striatum]
MPRVKAQSLLVLQMAQHPRKRWLKTCSDALIGARIKSIFDDEHGLYGAKRIAASLNDDKDFPPINHKKVARIMKAMG